MRFNRRADDLPRKVLTEAQAQELRRLGFNPDHWYCPRCRGEGKVEVTGTGQYDSDNAWVPCTEVMPCYDEDLLEEPYHGPLIGWQR